MIRGRCDKMQSDRRRSTIEEEEEADANGAGCDCLLLQFINNKEVYG